VRIPSQHLLDLDRQAVHSARHIGVADRQPHPHAGRNRDHRRASALTTAANTAGIEPTQSIPTRSSMPNVLLPKAAVPCALPRGLEFQICMSSDQPPEGDEWLHQLKHDG
jgi:hypothetical protein